MAFRVNPESPRPLWLAHRVLLTRLRLWRRLVLPNGESLTVRFLAEGRYNLVLQIKGEDRLLKILRTQFYNPDEPVETDETLENCRIMNSLAARGIFPECEHICGGAYRVENAGPLIQPYCIKDRSVTKTAFAQLYQWSMENDRVILDFNERNWCYGQDRLRLVDFDLNFTCSLEAMSTNPIVTKRVSPVPQDPGEALQAFYAVEESLLWDFLNGVWLPES